MERVLRNKPNILRNRDFMLLIIGKIVSNVGNSLHNAAVAWYIMSLVGEKSAGVFMGIFGMCSLIPSIIFGPISGVFVDKIDRKKIIVGTDFIRGGLILLLALLSYFDMLKLWILFGITAISAFFATFFNPAVSATIPNIVEEKDLNRANSLDGMSLQLSWIVGVAISGFLYYWIGILGIFILNGISFIISGISETFINIPPIKRDIDNTNKNEWSFWKDFKEGVVFLKRQKAIVVLLGFALVINFLFNPIFQIVFPKTIKFTLNLTAKENGILSSAFPIGAIIGMFMLSILPSREKYYMFMINGIIADGLIIILFGIPLIFFKFSLISSFGVYVIFLFLILVLGVVSALVNVPINTTFQKIVPDEFRGRFFGILNTLTQGIVPLGLAVLGYISDKLASSTIFIFSGIIVSLLGIWMFFIPELREF
ncbi:MFS transporter [Caloranaerobacter ferrireducens]|uniref:MFS transporter n=1 Tax=Caloranaerobacter ferrireducens TaxID=1323370 RepID=UPI00084DF84E|nr:MFS transporter [Caloranaerobacter ferrireducens]